MMGVLKEDTDTEGIQTFQNNFYPFPLYVDQELQFYKALGNRKLRSWNIFKMLTSYPGLKKRLASKSEGGIAGNYKGEGLLQGGVLLTSGTQQEVVLQYTEKTGNEVPVTEIESKVIDLNTK